MSTQPDIATAADNLSRSVTRLAQSTADYVQARLEQADQVVRNERQRRLLELCSAGALLLCLIAGAVFAGLAFVMAFGETGRVLAAALVAGAFFTLAGGAAWILRVNWRRQPSILDWLLRIPALIREYRGLHR